VKEAGALLIGGHTVDEMNQSMVCLSRVARPRKYWPMQMLRRGYPGFNEVIWDGIFVPPLKQTFRPNDGAKGNCGNVFINKEAALGMKEAGVNCATDITGFGFLGHLG
jgi:selenide,water dikinase